ncbi:MAG: PspC domain-containing protein [FCB group bacterium]|nr:PspC domain-containing protein [FCB group bacterium]
MKKVYRKMNEKRIAGVCAGIADYFDIDPVLVRLAFLAFLLVGGAGIPTYLIAWFIIPPDTEIQ